MSITAGDIVINLSIDDKDMKVTFKEAGTLLRQFQGTVDTTARSVKKLEDAQESLSTKFRHLVMTLGNLRFVAMDVHDVFLRLPVAILKTAGEMERMQVLMTGLSTKLTDAGKAAEGAASFDYIIATAKKVPFEIGAIADSFIKFKTAGLDPTNGSMRSLLDATAKFGGNSELLKRAGVAIQQMAGKGVISMEELRQQLGEAIPTAMRDMATGMGMSMQELNNAVKKGTVGSITAIEKMLLRMEVTNIGASKAMMQTWVGTLSRLRTEWDLTAKFIADSGFGDEAKKVVAELIDGLKSDEFKRFALTFGEALGTVARTLKNLADTAHQYGSTLLFLAGAWVVLKTNASLVVPAFKALKDQIGEMRGAWQGVSNKLNEQVATAREAAIAQAESAKATADAELLASSRRVGALQAEMNYRRAEAAEILAINNATRAALAASFANGTGVRDAATGRMGSRQAAVDRIAEIAAVGAANSAAMRAAKANLEIEQAAHRQSTLAAAGHTEQLLALGRSATTASVGTRMLAAATTALGFAFTAIGGWVGLITIALAAGAWAWAKWGNAAEDAAKRAKRASLGLSEADDLKKAMEFEQSKLDMLTRIREANAKRLAAGHTEHLKKGWEAEKKAEAELADARKVTEAAKVSLLVSNSRDESSAIALKVGAVTDAIVTSTKLEIQSSQKALEDRVKGMKEGSAEYQAEVNKAAAAETKMLIAGKTKQRNALQAARDSLIAFVQRGKGSEAEINAARQEGIKFGEEIKQLNDEIAHNIATNEKKNDIQGGHEKGLSPAQRLIAEMKAQEVELKAEIASFKLTMNDMDKGAAEAAKVRAKMESGLYNEHDGKKIVAPTKSEIDTAAKLKADLVNMQEAIKIAGDIGRDARGIEVDFKHAQEIFADPFAETKTEGKLGAFDKMIAKLGASAPRVHEALGMTVAEFEKFTGEVRSKLGTIDLAEPFRAMADETKKLGFDLILNDRARTQAQIQYDNDLFQVRMLHRIEEARAAGASAKDIDLMEKALVENTVARAKSMTEKLKTPMEKLADQWQDSTKQMQDATARWAQGSIDAIVNMAQTGKLELGKFVEQVLLDLLKIQAQKAMGAGMSAMFSGFGAWASSLMFAGGGVMSSMGSLPLKKYAAGGIAKANQPQHAVFGEGDMNEAYVPLPDGRRIPVAMQGGSGGTNVVVNVINQTSTPVNASQGQPRFDGKQLVLDVVIAAASQPGPFRDNMRSMMDNK